MSRKSALVFVFFLMDTHSFKNNNKVNCFLKYFGLVHMSAGCVILCCYLPTRIKI